MSCIIFVKLNTIQTKNFVNICEFFSVSNHFPGFYRIFKGILVIFVDLLRLLFFLPVPFQDGTQIFLIAPYFIRKRADTVLHAGLYLLKRHRRRTVIPDIQHQIRIRLSVQTQQLLPQPVHPRLIHRHQDGNAGLTDSRTSAHSSSDTRRK